MVISFLLCAALSCSHTQELVPFELSGPEYMYTVSEKQLNDAKLPGGRQ